MINNVQDPSLLYQTTFRRNQFPQTNDLRRYSSFLDDMETDSKFASASFKAFLAFLSEIPDGKSVFHHFRNFIESEDYTPIFSLTYVEVVDNLDNDFEYVFTLEYRAGVAVCKSNWSGPNVYLAYLFMMKFACDMITNDFYTREQLRIYYLNVVSRDLFPSFFD